MAATIPTRSDEPGQWPQEGDCLLSIHAGSLCERRRLLGDGGRASRERQTDRQTDRQGRGRACAAPHTAKAGEARERDSAAASTGQPRSSTGSAGGGAGGAARITHSHSLSLSLSLSDGRCGGDVAALTLPNFQEGGPGDGCSALCGARRILPSSRSHRLAAARVCWRGFVRGCQLHRHALPLKAKASCRRSIGAV
ncbi:hypothetical protein L1887_51405 [Cichorium endivia]|nr:hypothetical protein L1887_51405 [Cichorium endivia]